MPFQKVQKNSGRESSRDHFDNKSNDNHGQGGSCRKDRLINPSIFISKTFQILEQYSDIVRWNPDGLTFIIEDVERFEQEILSIYFRHRNFSSFVRQLNMYDFHKIRNEANSNIFEHKQFRRNCQHSLKNIKRKGCQSKKNIANEQSDGENKEPEYISSKKIVGRSKQTVDQSPAYMPKVKGSRNISKTPTPKTNSLFPSKEELIDDFVNSLPEIIHSEREMEEMVREMKKNPKYSCLNSKEDLKDIVRKIKFQKMKREVSPDDLEELSIQEEIIVQSINGPPENGPSLAIVSTQKCLPIKSISIIDSLNFGRDAENLIYPN